MPDFPFQRLGEPTPPGPFRVPNRPINTGFVHCTASSNPNYGIAEIHRDHIIRDFRGFGYHYLITFSGRLLIGRDLEAAPEAQKGYNTGSIAICLQGLKVGDFTEEQFKTLRELVGAIDWAYLREGKPALRWRGHKEVAARDCPVFDYKRVLSLNEKGFVVPKKLVDTPAPVREDAVVGWKQELRDFQARHGLNPDGVVGPATWATIRPYLNLDSEK